MTFEEKAVPILTDLARQLLERREYLILRSVADWLAAFSAGDWKNLSKEEQIHNLHMMRDSIPVRGMGEDRSLNKYSGPFTICVANEILRLKTGVDVDHLPYPRNT